MEIGLWYDTHSVMRSHVCRGNGGPSWIVEQGSKSCDDFRGTYHGIFRGKSLYRNAGVSLGPLFFRANDHNKYIKYFKIVRSFTMSEKKISEYEDKLVYTVDDIQQIFDIGKTCAYRLMTSEGFPKLTLNKRLYVTKEALQEWLREQTGRQFCY